MINLLASITLSNESIQSEITLTLITFIKRNIIKMIKEPVEI